ncbi:MAG: flagellar biosynthetic protein FliO [Gemmatimonadetes bacterium]|nr:flagellar biosynthetic protein FliO [Gemmatimonadota bacterium]
MKRVLLVLLFGALSAFAPADSFADEAGMPAAVPDAAATDVAAVDGAAADAAAADAPVAEASSLFADRGGVDPTRDLLMRWFGVMGLLVAVGGVAWFLLKRGRFAGLAARRGQMHVVDRLFLGPKRSIQVVQIGTKQLVVGITEMQITTLGELEEGALVSLDGGPGQTRGASFSSFLQGANRTRDEE